MPGSGYVKVRIPIVSVALLTAVPRKGEIMQKLAIMQRGPAGARVCNWLRNIALAIIKWTGGGRGGLPLIVIIKIN